MNKLQKISPKEFNDKLVSAEDKFMNPKTGKAYIPATITMDPEAEILPYPIRLKMGIIYMLLFVLICTL